MSNKMEKTFILENITPPVFRDGKEIVPPGYIIFPSLWHYKKIKKINGKIRDFYLKLNEEMSNKKFLNIWIGLSLLLMSVVQ